MSFFEKIQYIITFASLSLATTFFLTWIVLVEYRNKVFRRLFDPCFQRFRHQSKFGKCFTLLFLLAAILYAGTKPQSNNGEVIHSASPDRDPPTVDNVTTSDIQESLMDDLVFSDSVVADFVIDDAMTSTSNKFNVVGFYVDSENKEIEFELCWNQEYINLLDSRYVDLFMSLDLSSNIWHLINYRYLPQSTNRAIYSISNDDVIYDIRPLFLSSFTNKAFFVWGLGVDTDGDYLTDAYEKYITKTSAYLSDSDRDGLRDDYEEDYGSNAFSPDSDGDGLLDGEEYHYGTGMLTADKDEDGLSDSDEVYGQYSYNSTYWQEGSIQAILFDTSFDDVDNAIAEVALDSPIVIAGSAYTNLFVDVNGLVYLSGTNRISESLSVPQDISSVSWNKTDIAIAPLWTDLILKRSLGSQILLKETSIGDYVIEYLNVGFNDVNYSTNTFCAQVVFSPAATNRIVVTYRGFNREYTYRLSKYGRCGVRVDNGFYTGSKCYQFTNPQDGDSTFVYRFGYGTYGNRLDSDGDDLTDYEEIYVYRTDPTSSTDTDNDGLTDGEEINKYGTNRSLADTDGDGVNDGDEVYSGEFDPLVDESMNDADGDGLSDLDEYFDYGTSRYVSDCDDDILSDYDEVMIYDTNPKGSDSDNDGLLDGIEIFDSETSPNDSDTDADTLPDGWEYQYGLDPNSEDGSDGANGDPDGDGLTNQREYTIGSNPNLLDTDSDGLSDSEEAGRSLLTTNIVPFNCSNGVSLLNDNQNTSYDDQYFNVPLPFKVDRFGIEATNMVVDVNGIIGLVNKGCRANSYGRGNSDLSSIIDSDQITVAAYWDDLEADVLQGSDIAIADVSTNGTRYCVVEYKNIVLYNHDFIAPNLLTLQIVIPQDSRQPIFVQYLSCGSEVDGRSATIGFQGSDKVNLLVSYNATGFISTGNVIEYYGFGTSPVLADTDGDGLNDDGEFHLQSSPFSTDTDEDGMSDGWEVKYRLDPTSSEGENGADGDLDGDGLSNAMEHLHGAHPNVSDTDGDGLSDLKETGGAIISSFPWHSFTSSNEITGMFASTDNACVDLTLPMPLIVDDVGVMNITIDLNGLIYLRKPEYSASITSQSSPSHMRGSARNRQTLSLAPFWNNMAFVTNEPASKISVGLASLGTNQYYLIEYANIRTTASDSAATNRISFQVAIPYGGTDRIFVRYGNMGGATDSKYASVGFQNFGGQQKHSYCYEKEDRIRPGLSLAFVIGENTNPSAVDTDGDGLLDVVEIQNGTNPIQPDTDGDGLYDGWEVEFGFNPSVDNTTDDISGNDPTADPDGDGLSNSDECGLGANPHNDDTDGDGVADGTEISQNSDPADATDSGIAGSRAPVQFTFGDHSGSHSEKYHLFVTPIPATGTENMPREYKWVNAQYGECDTFTALLARGVQYRVTMAHAGTNEEEEPDYDYSLRITPKSSAGVLIEDPENLIAESDMTSDYFSGEGKSAIIKVLNASLCADYNRDGKIDSLDEQILRKGGILRHWVNDDADKGDVADDESDNLNQGWASANCRNSRIDGRCDLLDFIPVRLDVNELLNEVEDFTALSFKLSHEDEAVNVAWSDLSSSQANAFLTQGNSVYGPSFNKPAYEAPSLDVQYSGTIIPKMFISKIADDPNKGIILIEGRTTSTSPLRFEVYKGNKKIFAAEMALSISSVEDMYRRVSFRSFYCPSSISTPRNNPDDSYAKDVFFLHGFSVTEKEARAWNAEMFKRLWQSGAKMKFWGVTWKGDEGVPDAFHYQDNVYNAFRTASALATLVNGNGTGDKIVMAHSLGNMVVSSAIQDYGMNVSKYFMLNSAVPAEVYNPSLHNTAVNNVLVHEEWRSYANRTWSSEWHTHFPATDDRSKLTWKNRFPNVASVAYNYYSTGDEVLELFNGTPDPMDGGIFDSNTKGRYAWHKQEVYKGRGENVVFDWATTDWSGWGFRENWLEMRMYSAEEANALESLSLTTNTVFTLYPSTMNVNVISRLHLDENLAKGIPALSPATGRIVFRESNGNDSNLDADESYRPNGWWRTSGDLKNRWLHSDIKDVAFYYVYSLFHNFVDKGALK